MTKRLVFLFYAQVLTFTRIEAYNSSLLIPILFMKPFVIGITGGSGSGKTTFIDRIKSAFEQHQLSIVSQDNYYLPNELQALDKNGIENYDLPSSFNHESFYTDMLKLTDGETLRRKEYVFNDPSVIPGEIVYEPAPIILIEGLYVFHTQAMRDLFDLKIFIHAKDEHKIIRRIKRDAIERNYSMEDVIYRYQYHVMPNFEQFIKPHQDKVDLVVNNNESFDRALRVVIGFLRNHLYEQGV
ncbi:MAG: P-loop NTPase fold protein [Bacteroidota bacterium]